jgi:hypothetical protein
VKRRPCPARPADSGFAKTSGADAITRSARLSDRRRLAIEIPELTELLNLEHLDISILGFEPIEIEQIRLTMSAMSRSAKALRPPNAC